MLSHICGKSFLRKFWLVLLIAAVPVTGRAAKEGDKNLGWPGTTLAGLECWGKRQGYGPIDYNVAPQSVRDKVEWVHFTPVVENLIGGEGGTLLGDLDYTLRAIPNHQRALWAMSRYYLREIKSVGIEKILTSERARQGAPPPECYYIRAMAFAPEDAMMPAMFGIYLHRRGMLDAALKSYLKSEEKLPENAELAYNIGLLYFDMNNFDKANEYAKRAQALGYPLTGLQKKIARNVANAQRREPDNESPD